MELYVTWTEVVLVFACCVFFMLSVYATVKYRCMKFLYYRDIKGIRENKK